jgi:hypothetical protein
MSPIAPPRQLGTVLVAIKAATRRLRRWPLASLDRDGARRREQFAGRDEETLPGRTKKLTFLSSLNSAMHPI